MLFNPAGRRLGGVRLLVVALAGATFLQWTGASAVLPLLPLYLAERGNPSGLIGAVMAGFFATGVLAQFASGPLGDRIGHRRVLVAGLLGYAVASAGFVFAATGWNYLGLRAVQGLAAGAVQVASLSLVARAVPVTQRGRAYAALSGAQLAGVAIGPMLGSVAGMAHMATLFLVSAGLAALACLPLLGARAAAVGPAPSAGGVRERLSWRGIAGRAMIGALIVAVVDGALTGAYEACWSLLLHLRGASDGQIGLSWTLFAVPFVAVSPLAGWLADRWERRALVAGGLVICLSMAVAYPFLPGVYWLLGLGMLESVGFAISLPAAQSLLSEHVPTSIAGRAQGLFVGLQTAAIAAFAVLAGGLFDVAAWAPFVIPAAVGMILLGALLVVWRGVPGRVGTGSIPHRGDSESSGGEPVDGAQPGRDRSPQRG